MELNTVWFILVTILFCGYFLLEGFDYGVGMLLPFVARDDRERRLVINSIGPVWDGNEVWLLTAGGAIFAAFPHWYATMFSGFYLALVLVLVGLILRGVAMEFRSKAPGASWRAGWDWAIFVGSLIPALIFGVAVGNLLRGVPIDETKTYTGTFLGLLNPYSLVAGLTFVLLFLLHGACFLRLRVDGPVRERVDAAVKRLWSLTVLVAVCLLAFSWKQTGLFKGGAIAFILPGLAALALVGAGLVKKPGVAFGLTAATILLLTASAFRAMYPNVMISTLNPAWSLTIHNASSTPYTLKVMTIIACTMVPVVLLYQGWTYWIFRKRLTGATKLEY